MQKLVRRNTEIYITPNRKDIFDNYACFLSMVSVARCENSVCITDHENASENKRN